MKRDNEGYRPTKKALPEDFAGQRRAVYDAIAKGARDAASVREAVRANAAFKGRTAKTIAQNTAWHVAQLRKGGFIRGGR